MKFKHIITMALLGVFLWVAVQTPVQTTAAQQQSDVNLLTNPSFEDGYFFQDNIPEIAVPNGWRMHYLDNVPFDGSTGNAARPETVVWFKGDAPPDEQGLFFRQGNYALKVFKGGLPVYAGLSQDVSGLEVGRKYRLVAPIFIDIVERWENGAKIAPGKLSSGVVRLGAGPVGSPWLEMSAINYSGFWTAETISPFYQAYPVFVYDFTATSSDMTVYIEMGSRDSYANNGFFIDTPGLYALEEVDDTVNNPPPAGNPPPQAGPSPTPFPTPTPRPDGAIVHVVQEGDSLWSLAIRYSSALGLTAEETLAQIRELNGNPAFISVGQEILVSPGVETAAPPATDTTTEGTTEDAAAGGADAGETEAAATPEPAPAEPTPEPMSVSDPVSAICVSAFNDENGDGRHDDNEGLLSDAVFTLSHTGGNIATYVSDGISEPKCFEGLEPNTYQIAFSPPADLEMTTAGNWAVAVSGGDEVNVEFGAKPVPEVIAEAPAADTTTTTTDTAVDNTTDATTTDAPAETGGFFSNIGAIVLIAAVILIILAGVGVALLRRS